MSFHRLKLPIPPNGHLSYDNPLFNVAFCEVLMSTNRYNVFGTSRSSNNPKLTRLGVTTVVFQYDSEASISDALDIAKPSFLVIITDFVNAAKMNKETEIRHAKIIIDACKQAPCLTHVIFSSVFGADTCPEQLSAFRSKFVIENYLKESGLSHSILRPGQSLTMTVSLALPHYSIDRSISLQEGSSKAFTMRRAIIH